MDTTQGMSDAEFIVHQRLRAELMRSLRKSIDNLNRRIRRNEAGLMTGELVRLRDAHHQMMFKLCRDNPRPQEFNEWTAAALQETQRAGLMEYYDRMRELDEIKQEKAQQAEPQGLENAIFGQEMVQKAHRTMDGIVETNSLIKNVVGYLAPQPDANSTHFPRVQKDECLTNQAMLANDPLKVFDDCAQIVGTGLPKHTKYHFATLLPRMMINIRLFYIAKTWFDKILVFINMLLDSYATKFIVEDLLIALFRLFRKEYCNFYHNATHEMDFNYQPTMNREEREKAYAEVSQRLIAEQIAKQAKPQGAAPKQVRKGAVKAEPQGLDVDLEQFMALPVAISMIGGFLCYGKVPKGSDTDKAATGIADKFANIAKINNGVKGAVSLFKILTETLQDIIHYFVGVMAPYSQVYKELDEEKHAITKWIAEVNALDREETFMRLQNDPELRTHINRLRDRADRYMQIFNRMSDPPRTVAAPFLRAQNIITKISNKATHISLDVGARLDPFCFCLTGKTGLGKSFLTSELIHAVADVMDVPKFKRIYARSLDEKFWSDYCYQFGVIIDDFGQLVDAKTFDPYFEFFMLKSNIPRILAMAEVSEKGRIFQSKVIGMSTNTPFPRPVSISDFEALWRRRDMLIQVEQRDGVEYNGVIGSTDHLKFSIMDSVKSGVCHYTNLSFGQLRDMLVKQAVFHLKKQVDTMRYLNRREIEALPQITHENMRDHLRSLDVLTTAGLKFPEEAEPAEPRGDDERYDARSVFDSHILKTEGDDEIKSYDQLRHYAFKQIKKGRKKPVYRPTDDFVSLRYYSHYSKSKTPYKALYDNYKDPATFIARHFSWLHSPDRKIGEFDPLTIGFDQSGFYNVLPWWIFYISKMTNTSRMATPIFPLTRDYGHWLFREIEDLIFGNVQMIETPEQYDFEYVSNALENYFSCMTPEEEYMRPQQAEPQGDDPIVIAGPSGNYTLGKSLNHCDGDCFVKTCEEYNRDFILDKNTMYTLDHHIRLKRATGEFCDVCYESVTKPENQAGLFDGVLLDYRQKIAKFFEEHPRIKESLNILSIIAGVGTFAYAAYNMFKEQESDEEEEEAEQAEPENKAYFRDQTQRAKRVQRNVVRPGKARAQNATDSNADDVLLHRIRPSLARISLIGDYNGKLCQKTGMNALQFKGQFFLVNRHLMTKGKDGDQIRLQYQDGREYYVNYDEKNFAFLDETDLAIFHAGMRVPAAKDSISLFIKDDDLQFINNTPTTVMGIDENVIPFYYETQIRPFEYPGYELTGTQSFVREGWLANISTKKGSCGSVAVMLNPQIARKIVGIHAAGLTHKATAIFQVVTQEMLKDLVAEFPYNVIGTSLDQAAEHFGLIPEPAVPQADFGSLIIEPFKAPPRFQPIKTHIKESMVFDEIFEHTTEPSVKSYRDKRLNVPVSPMIKGVLKYSSREIPFPQADFESVREEVKVRCLEARSMRPNPGRLTIEEAINGLPIKHYDSMDMSTSPGIPYVYSRPPDSSGKRYLFSGEDGALQCGSSLLLNEVTKRERAYLAGIKYTTVWQNVLKDERRTLQKIRDGATRVFMMPPVDFTMLGRMYFLDFIAAMMNHRASMFHAVGIDPESSEWLEMFQYLRSNSSVGWDGDYGRFDGTLKGQLVEAVAEIVNDWYNDGPECAQVRYCIVEEMLNNYSILPILRGTTFKDLKGQTHHIEKDIMMVVMKTIGNPSGNFLTTILNSIVNAMYTRLAWMGLARAARSIIGRKFATMMYFNQNVRDKVFGDDNIISVKMEVLSWFNQQTFAEYLSRFSLEYTPAIKNAGLKEWSYLHDCQFLKRGFRFDKDRPFRLYAPIEINSIRELLNWVTDTNDPKEQLELNVEDAFKLVYHYGIKVFNEFKKEIRGPLLEVDIHVDKYHYSDFDAIYESLYD
jgi:hypothetical protein